MKSATSSHLFPHPASGKAFSLLEVLIAVALGGVLLGMVAFQIVSLSNIWMTQNDDAFFEEHANAVAEFLGSAMTRAEASLPAANDSASSNNSANPPNPDAESTARTSNDPRMRQASGEKLRRVSAVEWTQPPGGSDLDEPFLSFRLREAPPLLQEYDIPFPHIVAYLHYTRGEGLALLWHSELAAEVEDLNDVNITALSTFIHQLEFCYYDPEEESWECTDEPIEDENNQRPLPEFIKLHFRYGEIEITRSVYLPPANQNVPLF